MYVSFGIFAKQNEVLFLHILRNFTLRKNIVNHPYKKISTLRMEAFLMAAGLGTRLQPLTLKRPKALVEVDGRPLLQINIERLAEEGVQRIVVNTHHFSRIVIDYLASHVWPCEVVVSDESALLLDTGGGLKHAAPLFSLSQPIVIYNVDILSSFPLAQMLQQHKETQALATLAVSERITSRHLLFDHQHTLVGWRNTAQQQELWVHDAVASCCALAFSGIAIVDPQLLSLLPLSDKPYGIVPEYLKLARQYRIQYYLHRPDQWIDVGKPETLPLAKVFLSTHSRLS